MSCPLLTVFLWNRLDLKFLYLASEKIGLKSADVINQNVKIFLRKHNQSNDDDTESTNYNSEDEKEFETSDHNDSNVADGWDEDGEVMDDYDDTNDDVDSILWDWGW